MLKVAIHCGRMSFVGCYTKLMNIFHSLHPPTPKFSYKYYCKGCFNRDDLSFKQISIFWISESFACFFLENFLHQMKNSSQLFTYKCVFVSYDQNRSLFFGRVVNEITAREGKTEKREREIEMNDMSKNSKRRYRIYSMWCAWNAIKFRKTDITFFVVVKWLTSFSFHF